MNNKHYTEYLKYNTVKLCYNVIDILCHGVNIV